MDDADVLAKQFEEHRSHLRAVAYQMLGSRSDAEDAVQEAWLRLSRSDVSEVENLGGWLTTVVARLCLTQLRSRKAHPEESLDVHVPDPIVASPEQDALVMDSIGLALLVVLETLAPAERIAFVLHDSFAIPFDDIAQIIDRSPAATRQLASRARRRLQGVPVPDVDLAEQRKVVDAFFAAARDGDFDALVAVLDPDVMIRSDGGTARPHASVVIRGAAKVASRALLFKQAAPSVQPAVINGVAGIVAAPQGRPYSVMAFTVRGGKIVEIYTLADPDRLDKLDLSGLAD